MAMFAEITPGEAMVLLDPYRVKAADALKVTLIALLVQRVLRIDTESKARLIGKSREIAHVRLADRAGAPLPAHSASVVELVRSAGNGTMREIVARAGKIYGLRLSGFLDKLLRPGLVARGLLAPEKIKIFLVFNATRFSLTPAGAAERDKLTRAMEEARTIPSFLDSDPARAAAMAAALGGMLLLIPELKPHLKALSDAMRHDVGSDIPDGGFDDFSSGNDFDFGSFDGGAFDALDASMSAMDSGFDAAASDSGGSNSGSSDSSSGGE